MLVLVVNGGVLFHARTHRGILPKVWDSLYSSSEEYSTVLGDAADQMRGRKATAAASIITSIMVPHS